MNSLRDHIDRGQRPPDADQRTTFAKLKTAIRDYRWRRLKQRCYRTLAKPVLLHVGCGAIDAHGFINIDARRQRHVHIVTRSLFRLKMIPDDVADLVYMCHVLEHVSHGQLHDTLRELKRVLRPGGVLRLSVPDFDLLLEIYRESGRNVLVIERALMGGQNYAFNFHYSVFNRERLGSELLRAGFTEVRPWNPAEVDHHDFEDWASRSLTWRDREFPVSLNLEGVK